MTKSPRYCGGRAPTPRQRTVKLGMRADGYAEVLDGVAAGEQVVVRANFLIDAESNLKAALQSFGQAEGAGQKSQAVTARLHRGQGKVSAVNATAGTVELEHGPIASLNWPAMKMEFKTKDKALVQGLKPGQAVEFELTEQAPGELVVQRIAPQGKAAHPGH